MAFLDETGVTTLTSDIKTLTDATYPANATIVDAYSSSSAYAVGDFCIYSGLFYKCNTAISSGESWTPAHWTQTNVTSEWGTKMVVLSYGSSTWADFQAAFDANAIVYCKASSNTNPATGNQGRMAFMAYVGYSGSTITNVEFQYYRSVSTHSDSQQGDQVFIYKLESTNGGKWTVTTREAFSKIVAGTGLSSSYSNGTLTLTNNQTAPSAATATPLMDGTATVGASDKYAREDHVHPTDTNIFDLIYPVGSIYMSVNSTSPASLFGGTWEQIKDTFLLSAGDVYAAGATGGAEKHKHTTGGHSLTVAEMPSHNHNSKTISGWIGFRHALDSGAGRLNPVDSGGICSTANSATTWQRGLATSGTAGKKYDTTINATHTHDSQGSGSSHSHGDTGETSNLPPYLAVYVWKRAA